MATEVRGGYLLQHNLLFGQNMNVDVVGRFDMVDFALQMRSDVTCRARLEGPAGSISSHDIPAFYLYPVHELTYSRYHITFDSNLVVTYICVSHEFLITLFGKLSLSNLHQSSRTLTIPDHG